jgi:3-hydroxyisobutyrate dehydrogenase-like beta-hydroxyacid dehydrogenase
VVLDSTLRVGFMGLGTMGSAMALRLIRHGYHVTVFNRTRARTEPLARAGATVAADLAELTRNSDVIGSCLRDGPAVKAVYTGSEGLLSHGRAGQVIFEHGTFAPQVAREIAIAAARIGAQFLDIPVTGGPERAASGQLTAMAGGQAETLNSIRPVLAAYTANVAHLGAVGRGLELKLVNQLLVSVHMAAAGEAVRLIDALLLDRETSRTVLGQGWAQSTMLDRTFEQLAVGGLHNTGATIEGLIEVQQLVADALRGAGAPGSIFEAARQRFVELGAHGYGESDPAVLATAPTPRPSDQTTQGDQRRGLSRG